MKSGDLQPGAAAERLAARMLADQGHSIVATNYRARPGEIDIISTVGEIIVFVEVKERTGDRYGGAEEAVDDAKIKRILATAEYFISEHPRFVDYIWRLDLIAITLRRDGTIERKTHIENLVID